MIAGPQIISAVFLAMSEKWKKNSAAFVAGSFITAAFFVFHRRKTAEPPKWMGALQTASPRLSFRLGLLLLGVFPTDILTSTAVGLHLAREDEPWFYGLAFVLLTTLLIAIPSLLVLVLGQRGVDSLPKVRDWMSSNSWIVSEAVIALFVLLQVNTLLSS